MATNLLHKAKGFWGWFIKKSPAFIVLTSFTIVSVFGLGVGGTLAATGVIPNPFASSTSDESSPEELEGSWDPRQLPLGDGTLPSDVGEWGSMGCVRSVDDEVDEELDCPDVLVQSDELGRRQNVLIQSGWTGVLYNFAGTGFYGYTLIDATVRGDLTLKLEINGRPAGHATIHDCKPNEPRGNCNSMLNIPLNQRDFWVTYFGVCQAGGDTYVVEASGAGYYFRESGTVPPEAFNCPTAKSTPSASPTASPPSTPNAPSPELQASDSWISWTGIESSREGSNGENGNWGSTSPTITDGTLEVLVDAAFDEDTKILLGANCSYLLNGAMRLGCAPALPSTVFASSGEWSGYIPFQINIRNVGIEKPESLTIYLSIQDSRGLRNVEVNFNFGPWGPYSPEG